MVASPLDGFKPFPVRVHAASHLRCDVYHRPLRQPCAPWVRPARDRWRPLWIADVSARTGSTAAGCVREPIRPCVVRRPRAVQRAVWNRNGSNAPSVERVQCIACDWCGLGVNPQRSPRGNRWFQLPLKRLTMSTSKQSRSNLLPYAGIVLSFLCLGIAANGAIVSWTNIVAIAAFGMLNVINIAQASDDTFMSRHRILCAIVLSGIVLPCLWHIGYRLIFTDVGLGSPTTAIVLFVGIAAITIYCAVTGLWQSTNETSDMHNE